MKYRVHLYCTYRYVQEVEADSQLAAIEEAERSAQYERFNSWKGDFEFADEVTGALVDESGDEEYDNSHFYKRKETPPWDWEIDK